MITDELRKQLADQIKTLFNAGYAEVGLGGNSTSPAATTIDVPSSAGNISFSGASASAEKSDEKWEYLIVQIIYSLELISQELAHLVLQREYRFS